MTRSRAALLLLSLAAVAFLLGGGVFVGVGAADSSYRKAVLFSEVLSLVLENYVDPVDADRLLDGAYEGMLAGLDARSAFLTPPEVDAWVAASVSATAGPGVSVLKGFGGFQVVAVEPGSSAEDAGIEAGDQIRRIDGLDLADMSLDQGLRAIRGAPGTTLEVELLHPDDGFRRETVELVRRTPAAAAYMLDLRSDTVVVTLRDPARVATDRLRRELDDAASAGAVRLLFDLRNVVSEDPRGIARIAGLFVDGDVLQLRPRSGQEPVEVVRLESASSPSAWNGDLGVLVNGGTAGAAEAFAQVLRTRSGATVFGESTYGLGSEPRLFRLADGSGVLLAADVWELLDGETWDRDGLSPDEEIRGVGSKLPDRLDDQFEKTLRRFAGEAETESEAQAA